MLKIATIYNFCTLCPLFLLMSASAFNCLYKLILIEGILRTQNEGDVMCNSVPSIIVNYFEFSINFIVRVCIWSVTIFFWKAFFYQDCLSRLLKPSAAYKYSRLSKCSIAREFGLSLEGPTKVKAPESFLFTEGSLKIVNKEHLFDFVVTLYFISL